MRVAHFVHRYPPALGGSEAFFARLSCYLAERGERVRICTTNALDLEAFWSPRGQVLPATVEDSYGMEVRRYRICHWPGRRYLLKLLSLIPIRPIQSLTLPCNPICLEMWRDAGRERDVDLVHATAFPYAFPILCALRLARRCRVPFVLTPFLHLGDPREPHDGTRKAYLSPAMMYLLRAADRVFVQTEIERRALLDRGLPPERLIMLGMGVDPAECTGGDRAAARQRWGLQPDEVVIGHLANQSVEKGTVDLLRAAERLWNAGLQFRLLLAGPAMPNFAKLWKTRMEACPHRVIQLGVITETEKRDFYAAIDLFALPSRSDSFGIVFLEAWTNGVPCVGYRTGGVAEVVRHERDGLLVDCGEVSELAQALRRLVEDASYRRYLGRTGQVRVRRDYEWASRLERIQEVYRELVAKTQARLAGAGLGLSRTTNRVPPIGVRT